MSNYVDVRASRASERELYILWLLVDLVTCWE